MNLTFETFKKIMAQQILETFGRENFPGPRLELIWKAVNDLPEKNFVTIVRHFVGNHSIKYPPNVSDFIEAAHEQRKSLKAHETKQASNTLQTQAAVSNEELKRELDKIGAQEKLKKLGAKSLMDTIFKNAPEEASQEALRKYRKEHGAS